MPVAEAGELVGRVDLEDEARRREDVGREMRRVGVEHHQFGERVVLHLAKEVEAREAGQVVEAVAVLQILHLRLEDEVEGRAEQAAERHLLLGQAADPQVDGIDAGRRHAVAVQRIGARAVQEGEAVGRGEGPRPRCPRDAIGVQSAEDQAGGRSALVGERGCTSVMLACVP